MSPGPHKCNSGPVQRYPPPREDGNWEVTGGKNSSAVGTFINRWAGGGGKRRSHKNIIHCTALEQGEWPASYSWFVYTSPRGVKSQLVLSIITAVRASNVTFIFE
jgi:hypothetical protein